MSMVAAARNGRSTMRRDVRGEDQLMRLLVQLEHGACLPCFVRMTGLAPERLDAMLGALSTQIKIYGDEEPCLLCRRAGHVVRLFGMPAPVAFATSS